MTIEYVQRPHSCLQPYLRILHSTHRVKLSFRIDFENDGHLEGEDFLLDLEGDSILHPEAADMLISAMNLLRVETVIVRHLEVVRRGIHDDANVDLSSRTR